MKTIFMLKKSFFTFGIILLAAFISNAQVPQLINYQAILTDAQGNPINGVRSIQFSIYNAETGGNALWSETQNVIVTDGLCNVLLGAVTLIPYSVFDGGDRYFSLKVGSDPEMTLRKRMVSVRYAFHSNDTDSLNGYGASDFVRSVDGVTPDDGNIELVEGTNITIESNENNNTITISASGSPGGGDLTLPYTGTTESSNTAFSITNTGTGRVGYFKVNNSNNTNHAMFCETNGTGPAGLFRILNSGSSSNAVHGYTTGSGSALFGHTRGSGAAVNAETKGTGKAGNFTIDNAENNSPVIYGETNGLGRVGHFRITNSYNNLEAFAASTQGSGSAIDGYTTGTGKAGNFRIDNSDNNSPVIYGETNGKGRVGHFRIVNTENDKEAVAASTRGTGPALSGYTIGSGNAVYGRSDGTGEAGYFEITNSGSSSNGLYGSTNGTGRGVYGEHSSSGNFGYLGSSSNGVFGSSVEGNGVFGTSANSNGVKGYSVNGNGVDGFSVSGAAMSADGDLVVTGAYRGNITSTSGSDGAPFHRPAYDSGWTPVDPDNYSYTTFTHNIGGNPDNYVVDLQFLGTGEGPNHFCYGGCLAERRGAFWLNLNDKTITVFTFEGGDISDVRVRIWAYK
jgi:hypothetical protein